MMGLHCQLVGAVVVTVLTSTLALSLIPRGSDVLLKVPLIDGHNDLPYNLRMYVKNQLNKIDLSTDLTQDPVWGQLENSHTDLPRLRAGRLGAQFWSAFTECDSQYKDSVQVTLEQIDVIRRMVKAYPQDFQFVHSAQGILDAFKKGKIGSLIGVEGGHSIGNELAVLRILYRSGVRYMTLTHECNTPWADSSPADDPSSDVIAEHNGITTFGEAVVLEMNRLGMMVDLSHVSYKTMQDVLKITRAPVIFSHSSAYAICPHHRNVQDDILNTVRENGGVVMVNFFSEYVNCDNSRQATLEDVVAHINYIRQVAGVDHVGIGGDYDGVPSTPVGLEDVSKYPDLFDRLADTRPGEPVWTQEDLKKLAGLNLIRVFKQVELVRDQLNEIGLSPLESQIQRSDLKNNIRCKSDFYTVIEN
ncbi:hypothetical protein L9F63_012777 [Diploptera punctata]|uniref:Dipeptidase n=1 Tax=Diploptera punctata TaxID=6984 RepID=A0AAD8ABP9_DIPPU|nr:hypothetical protein L9F63_012777 [Diploptera punctata]